MEPTGPGRVERRLAAVFAADVAGYSRRAFGTIAVPGWRSTSNERMPCCDSS